MKILLRVVLVLLITGSFFTPCFALENTFYILRTNVPTSDEFTSLKNHYKCIDILITQAYHINAQGVVTGFVGRDLLSFANKNSIKVMALVTNVEFDKVKIHQFLSDTTAQQRAIDTLLNTCKQYHYYGVQFDFENIELTDKEALTRFYRAAAEALHSNGFIVSFAVIPVVMNGLQESAFLKRKYEDWGGAYDLQALGKSGDFISILAYDQHTHGTTPGPTASVQWVDAAIKYALQFVAPQKISLGIPTYSGHWFTDVHTSDHAKKIGVNLVEMNYEQVKYLLNKYHAKLRWDRDNKENYTIYEHNWLNEYIFVEDVQSFKAKLALAKKYRLRGISVFSLGDEDPKIWKALKGSLWLF